MWRFALMILEMTYGFSVRFLSYVLSFVRKPAIKPPPGSRTPSPPPISVLPSKFTNVQNEVTEEKSHAEFKSAQPRFSSYLVENMSSTFIGENARSNVLDVTREISHDVSNLQAPIILNMDGNEGEAPGNHLESANNAVAVSGGCDMIEALNNQPHLTQFDDFESFADFSFGEIESSMLGDDGGVNADNIIDNPYQYTTGEDTILNPQSQMNQPLIKGGRKRHKDPLKKATKCKKFKPMLEEVNEVETKNKKSKKRKKKKMMEQNSGNSSVRPNYFIAIRINDDEILKRVGEVQDRICKTVMNYGPSGVEFRETMISPIKLHVTLHVLSLKTENDVKTASDIFLKTMATEMPASIQRDLTLHLQGIGHFRNSVLFAKVSNAQGVDSLCELAKRIRVAYENEMDSEFVDRKTFQPHITIAKISKSKRLHKQKIRSFPKELWERDEHVEFGNQSMDTIQLLSMEETDPQTKYYKIIAEYSI